MKTKFKGWSSLECFSMLRYSVTNCLSNLNDLVLPLPTPFKMIPMLMLSFILLLLFSQEFCRNSLVGHGKKYRIISEKNDDTMSSLKRSRFMFLTY